MNNNKSEIIHVYKRIIGITRIIASLWPFVDLFSLHCVCEEALSSFKYENEQKLVRV